MTARRVAWLHAQFAAALLATPGMAASEPPTDRIEAGARLSRDARKGNCLACHAMPADPAAVTSANIGPPLQAIKQRFPDREKLRRQIWDAASRNPDTVMPPFGRNRILTPDEIDLIIEYLYTL